MPRWPTSPPPRFIRTVRDLVQIGEPLGTGYYVIFVRADDAGLRAALDHALDGHFGRAASCKALYEKYGLWTNAQQALGRGGRERWPAWHQGHGARAAGRSFAAAACCWSKRPA